MVDDAERRYGILGFHDDLSSSKALSTAAFSHQTSAFVKGQPRCIQGQLFKQ
jgi:hypothetical protein